MDLPQVERDQFLALACGDDRPLRQELDSLIASHEAADGFCEVPAAGVLNMDEGLLVAHHPRFEPGHRLGAYEISSFLSAGGMGEVYRARHTVLGRTVAIKTLRADSLEIDARRRLLREARHAATLSHPNICRIYEVGESQEVPFIVMELVEGRPLDELVRVATFTSDRVAACGAQIAAALEHAHTSGLIHRDLKSSNVVIDPGGRPIVLDFGLARRLGPARQTGESIVTREGIFAGTLSHMAPEVLVGAEADTRSDVWSLGVLLYQLATGELPFVGRTSFEMTAGILGEPPGPAIQRVPLRLRLAIKRCLEKDPADRYQTARDLRRELEALAQRSSWRMSVQVIRSARRRTLVAGSAVIALTALVLVGAAQMRRTSLAAGAELSVTSLGALPFENLSTDVITPHFIGAVHHELVSRLSGMAALSVTTRTSIALPDTRRPALNRLARDLGVGALLDGSVQATGDGLRVTVRVRNVSTGTLLREDGYNRDSGSVERTTTGVLTSADSAEIHALALRMTRAIVAAAMGGVASEPRLTFSSNRDGELNIYTMFSDGSEIKKITNGFAFAPSWSPDGSRIAFSARRGSSDRADREIYVSGVDGTNLKRLTTMRASAGWPRWAPDGSRIALHARVSDSGQDWQLLIMDADGSRIRHLPVSGSSLQPSWSPDGRRLVFLATPAGNTGALVHVINVDGTGLRQLTMTGRAASTPVWLPHGNRILFATPSARGSPRQIHVMNDDGSASTNLSRGPAHDDSPTWSSDGRIYFVRTLDTQRELFSMNMDGSDQRQLTYGGAASAPHAR